MKNYFKKNGLALFFSFFYLVVTIAGNYIETESLDAKGVNSAQDVFTYLQRNRCNF